MFFFGFGPKSEFRSGYIGKLKMFQRKGKKFILSYFHTYMSSLEGAAGCFSWSLDVLPGSAAYKKTELHYFFQHHMFFSVVILDLKWIFADKIDLAEWLERLQ
jgi:hypothetical protein